MINNDKADFPLNLDNRKLYEIRTILLCGHFARPFSVLWAVKNKFDGKEIQRFRRVPQRKYR
jgi:hypothetical protein